MLVSARAPRGNSRIKKAVPQRQVQIPQGLPPINRSGQGSVGVRTSVTSAQHPIDFEDYDEESKQGLACPLRTMIVCTSSCARNEYD